MSEPEKPLLVFDGVCVLCSRLLRFVLWADRNKHALSFATAQSEVGQKALKQAGQKTDDFETILLVFPDGRHFIKMDVVTEVAHILGSFWTILHVLKIVPQKTRNALYDFIAQRRYKWFGKSAYCAYIPPYYKNRIIK